MTHNDKIYDTLLQYLTGLKQNGYTTRNDDEVCIDDIINWVRQHTYTKNTSENTVHVEPIFRHDDLITDGKSTYSIEYIKDGKYYCNTVGNDENEIVLDIVDADKKFHKWTIYDAHDGDVVLSRADSTILLFKCIKDDKIWYYCDYMCPYWHNADDEKDRFQLNDDEIYYALPEAEEESDIYTLADSEDANMMFRAMKLNGYRWDKDKKEITPIEYKYSVGDWLIHTTSIANVPKIIHITDIKDGHYHYVDESSCKETTASYEYINMFFKKWTLNDARRGDILSCGDTIFILNSVWKDDNTAVSPTIQCYTYVTIKHDKQYDIYRANFGTLERFNQENVRPVTNEQRIKLFNTLTEEGYLWDSTLLRLTYKNNEYTTWNKHDEEMVDFIKIFMTQHDDYTYHKVEGWLNNIKKRLL